MTNPASPIPPVLTPSMPTPSMPTPSMLTPSMLSIATSLRAGEFSCQELCSKLLADVEKSKSLNAFLECDAARVLAEAEAVDRELKGAGKSASDKPLLGVPVAIKDMILTKGIKTTAASKILKDFVPPYDATVVEKLKAAGALIFGKTNLDEFAMGASNEYSAFGAVLNPWNHEMVPGGSSGGSAAAVAAGLCPAALGTDTGGSIRQPAAFTSTVGLKPTYGRVSRYGVVAFASSLDQVGVFTRNVADCAAISQVLFGKDPRDATSVQNPVPNLSLELGHDIKGLRIGIPKEYFIAGLDAEVKAAVHAALSVLESQGAKIVEISLPHTELAVATYYIIAPAEASSNLARYDGIRYGTRSANVSSLEELYSHTRGEGFGIEPKRRILIGSYVLSSGFYDAYYIKAQKCRTLVAKDFSDAFAGSCDVIASPTAPTTAFKIGEKSDDPVAMYLNDVFTIPVNLAGLPGISIPCGFSTNRLPIGLQLIGKPFDETGLLRVASAFEGATEWHKQRPSAYLDCGVISRGRA